MASKSMKSMKPDDLKSAAEQLKYTRPEDMAAIGEKMPNSSPEEIAHQINAADMLKKQGNELHSSGNYMDALQKYSLAKKNLKDIPSSKARTLSLACSLNMLSCYLKTRQYRECIKEGTEVLGKDSDNVKALYRRGQAYKELGQLEAAVSDLSKAHNVSADDKMITKALRDAKDRLVAEHSCNASRSFVIEEVTEAEETSPDLEEIRTIQNFISHARPEFIAAMNDGNVEGISPNMIKTACNMIGKMSPEELQRMLQMASSFQGENTFLQGGSLDSGFRPGQVPPNMSPDMLKMASDMMANMPAEELQNMFQMASSLQGKDSASTAAVSHSNGLRSDGAHETVRGNDTGETSSYRELQSSGRASQPSFLNPPADLQEQMKAQMKDPAMRQAAVSDLSKAHNVSADDKMITKALRDAKDRLMAEHSCNASRSFVIEEVTEAEETSPDLEAIRTFQNFVSHADPESIAAMNGGKVEGISPNMIKTASNMIGKMFSEELQRMLQMASSFQGENTFLQGGSLDSGFRPGQVPPNMSPDMLKMASDKMANMLAEEFQNMFQMASDKMANMLAEELQNMFQMASSLQGKDSASTAAVSHSNGLGSDGAHETVRGNDTGETSSYRELQSSGRASQPSFLNPPADLLRTNESPNERSSDAADVHIDDKKHEPDMMANMGEQFGVKLSQEDAEWQQAMSSLDTLDKMMRWADRAQRGMQVATKTKNLILGKTGMVLAICMLILAVILHRLGFIGS